MGQTTKVETHRFEHFGDNTVRTAAQLLGKLPNGWVLKSFAHRVEYGIGSWVAVVEGPTVDIAPAAAGGGEQP